MKYQFLFIISLVFLSCGQKAGSDSKSENKAIQAVENDQRSELISTYEQTIEGMKMDFNLKVRELEYVQKADMSNLPFSTIEQLRNTGNGEIYKCTYSLDNPFLENATQSITKRYVFNIKGDSLIAVEKLSDN